MTTVVDDVVDAMADKAAAEAVIGVAAAFDESFRYPDQPPWRLVWLGLRLLFWPGSDFRRAEIMGRVIAYAGPRS